MDNYQIISSLIIIGVGVYLKNYLQKKAENLATKEDLHEITLKVESLKAAIGSQQFIHQTRYQNEFNILMDLSEKVILLKDAALAFRPVFDSYDPKQPPEERKSERLKYYWNAYEAFYKSVEYRKPFYPEEIYKEVKNLEGIGRTELVQYKFTSDRGDDYEEKYWDNAMENAGKINKQTDIVLSAIRNRIKYWEEFNFKKE